MRRLDLMILVTEQRWNEVKEHFQNDPDDAAVMFDPLKGRTKLHWLCSIGATPTDLIDLVASLYPKAITLPDLRYGDTPLHVQCRNAQVTTRKVICMLEHLKAYESEQERQRRNSDQQKDAESSRSSTSLHFPPQLPRHRRSGTESNAILIRNQFGGTALHSACNHNAYFDVIEALVNSNPNLVRMATFDGIPPIAALYTSYIQTIPGYMAVAKTIKGETIDTAGHFERFWQKMTFLATADRRNENVPDPSRLVLHGLLRSSHLQVNLYKLPLKREPQLAGVQDEEGNYALHLLLDRRPFRLKERDAIESTIEANSSAVIIRNNTGDTPLLIAIRNKVPWGNGMDLLIDTAPTTIQQREVETNLFPFQFAAAQGGPNALDTTFELLTIQPDLLLV